MGLERGTKFAQVRQIRSRERLRGGPVVVDCISNTGEVRVKWNQSFAQSVYIPEQSMAHSTPW